MEVRCKDPDLIFQIKLLKEIPNKHKASLMVIKSQEEVGLQYASPVVSQLHDLQKYESR